MDRLDQIFHAIGRLEAQTEEIGRKQDEHSVETKAVREDLGELKASLTQVKAEVATAMPVVKRVQKWEQRVLGISLVGGLFGGGLLAQIKGWFW
jgi:chromosome segregation ATPase